MRRIRLDRLSAGAAALIVIAPLIFAVGSVHAQTMGEYGTSLSEPGAGGDASAGSDTSDIGTIGMSSSTLPPPASHPNPVAAGGGSTATVEVGSYESRVDDSSHHGDADDAASGDEWSASR